MDATGADTVLPFSNKKIYADALRDALTYAFMATDDMNFEELVSLTKKIIGDRITVLDASGIRYAGKVLQAGNSSARYTNNTIQVKPYWESGARNGAGYFTTVPVPNSSKCTKLHVIASQAPDNSWMEAVISTKNTAYVNSPLGGGISGDTVKVLGTFSAEEKVFTIPDDYLGQDLYIGIYSMSYGATDNYGIITDIWLTID